MFLGVFVKRVFYVIATLVEVAALVGIFLLNYFARAKLGMNRWLGYHNGKWEEGLPIPTIETLVIIGLIILAIAVVVMLWRRKTTGVIPVASVVASCVLVATTSAFVAFHATTDYRAYYLMAICFALASLLQLAKSLIIVSQSRETTKSR